jgi:hypothetical protein
MVVHGRAAAAVAFAGLSLLGGCAGSSPEFARIPYTASEAALADIPGMPHVRFYSDTNASVFDSYTGRVGGPAIQSINYLAMSGGGADGAFGAGFLRGLTESGRRPDFTIVSGVSTGALMAPLVFLGPRYDQTLEELYSSDLGSSLIKDVNILNGVFGNALVESDKLGHLVNKYITPEVMEAVAVEHRKGRRLFVATTNLDSQRGVVWDLGAIATSGSPNALSLFRQAITASASIPGLFPPRLVSVEANGRAFKEMHVDGSTIQQIFVAPDDVLYGERQDRAVPRFKNLYVLLNNKVEPTFEVTPNETLKVGTRSLSTVLRREVHNNVAVSFAYAKRHGIGFHLAAIPGDYDDSAADTFDPAFMRSLYAYGLAQGKSASPWTASPSLMPAPLGGNQQVAVQAQ